jgi:hypothetical protein
MESFINIIQDIFKAPYMQISIWKWEMRMIVNYGLDWGYKDFWDRY